MNGAIGSALGGANLLSNQENFNPYTGSYQNSGNIGPLASYGGQVLGASTQNYTPNPLNYTPTPTNTPTPANNKPPASGGNAAPQQQSNPNPSNYQGHVGDIVNGQRWTGVGWQDAGPSPTTQSQIDQANAQYAPIITSLQNEIPTLQGQQQSQTDTVTGQYNNLLGLLPGQQQSLMNPVNQQYQQSQYDTQSALAQAGNTAANLRQQAYGEFGGGSSAAEGISALAQNALYGQQGQIYQSQKQNDMNLQTNTTDIGQFIAGKQSDLQNGLQQATQQITSQFTDLINQVNTQIGITEQDREAQKMDILSTAQAMQQQLQLQANSLTNNLTLFAQAAQGYGNESMNSSLIQPFINSALNSQPAQAITPSSNAQQNASALSGSLSGNNNQNQSQQNQPTYSSQIPTSSSLFGTA